MREVSTMGSCLKKGEKILSAKKKKKTLDSGET